MHRIGLSLVRCPLEDLTRRCHPGLEWPKLFKVISRRKKLLARKISESGSELSVECTSFTDQVPLGVKGLTAGSGRSAVRGLGTICSFG